MTEEAKQRRRRSNPTQGLLAAYAAAGGAGAAVTAALAPNWIPAARRIPFQRARRISFRRLAMVRAAPFAALYAVHFMLSISYKEHKFARSVFTPERS